MGCVRVVAFQELISAHNESKSRTQYSCAIETRIQHASIDLGQVTPHLIPQIQLTHSLAQDLELSLASPVPMHPPSAILANTMASLTKISAFYSINRI